MCVSCFFIFLNSIAPIFFVDDNAIDNNNSDAFSLSSYLLIQSNSSNFFLNN